MRLNPVSSRHRAPKFGVSLARRVEGLVLLLDLKHQSRLSKSVIGQRVWQARTVALPSTMLFTKPRLSSVNVRMTSVRPCSTARVLPDSYVAVA